MTAQGEKVRPPAASSAGSRRWGGWEGSAFDACLVAGVRGAVEVGGAATVPPALIGVDLVEAGVGIRGEADGIKEVELGLGVEVARVRDARRCQVFLGLAGDVARLAGERIEGERIVDEELDSERLLDAERVEHGGGRNGEVLLGAGDVGETHVDETYVLTLDKPHDVLDGLERHGVDTPCE